MTLTRKVRDSDSTKKTRAHHQYVVVFMHFLECFLVISGFSMDMDSDPDSLSFLNSFSECWLVGRLQLSFSTLSQAFNYLFITCQDVCIQQSHAAKRPQATTVT